MEQSILDNGKIIRHQGKENFIISMEMFIKVIGKMIKLMVMAFTLTQNHVLSMQDIGKMTCSMELGFNSTQMEIDTRECSSKEGEMGKEFTPLQMEQYTMENG